MDWQRFFQGAAEMARGAAHAMTINRWSELDDNTAFAQIHQYVAENSVADIDTMDTVLLATTNNTLVPQARLRLIKFYSIFKIAEFARFGEFRGFPRLDT